MAWFTVNVITERGDYLPPTFYNIHPIMAPLWPAEHDWRECDYNNINAALYRIIMAGTG